MLFKIFSMYFTLDLYSSYEVGKFRSSTFKIPEVSPSIYDGREHCRNPKALNSHLYPVNLKVSKTFSGIATAKYMKRLLL